MLLGGLGGGWSVLGLELELGLGPRGWRWEEEEDDGERPKAGKGPSWSRLKGKIASAGEGRRGWEVAAVADVEAAAARPSAA